MILPIGHDASEVRRLPLVTLAVMAICALALLATDPSGRAAEAPALSTVEEAAEYWRERPYLEAPPAVLTEVAYDVPPNQRSQYLGLLRTSVDPPPDPAEVEAEQEILDAILLGEGTGAAAPEVESPYRTWGLRPDAPSARGFLTHMFMHAGWLHLLGNLFMLYLAGPALEDRWGRPLYALFYLLAGIASGALFLAMERENLPLVGASGAIAGVLGAFLVRYAKTQIRFLYVFFLGFRFLRGTFSAPAWAALPLWFGNELLAAFLGVDDGVAYWAHVGGFAFGVAAGLGIRRLGLDARADRAIEAKLTVRGNEAVDEALRLREAGDLEGAFAKLEAEARRSPRDSDAALAFWDAAVSLGRADAATAALARTIEALLPADVETAARCWLELCAHAPATRLDPRALLAIRAALEAQGLEEEAKRALRHAADPENAGLTPALALRVLDAARERDPRAAASAARVALASPHMPDEKKAKLRAQLAHFEANAPAAEASSPGAAARRREPIDIGPLEPESDLPVLQGSAHARFGREETGSEARAEPVLAPDAIRAEAEPETEAIPAETAAELVAEAVPAEAAAELAEAMPAEAAAELVEAMPAEDAAELVVEAMPVEDAAELEPEPEICDEELGALLGMPRFQDVKLMEAVPAGLDAQGVVLALPGDRSGRIAFEKIQAVAVAAVGGLAPRPVVLVDLLMNWSALDESVLRVVRLRVDRCDPRRLAPGAAGSLAALRAFLGELLARSGAAPLPDAEAARAATLRRFPDVASYQTEVLGVG